MKFSEMPYARPDLDAVKQQFADLLARFKAAATYAEAHAVFLEEEKLNKHVDTLAQLASVLPGLKTPPCIGLSAREGALGCTVWRAVRQLFAMLLLD